MTIDGGSEKDEVLRRWRALKQSVVANMVNLDRNKTEGAAILGIVLANEDGEFSAAELLEAPLLIEGLRQQVIDHGTAF